MTIKTCRAISPTIIISNAGSKATAFLALPTARTVVRVGKTVIMVSDLFRAEVDAIAVA